MKVTNQSMFQPFVLFGTKIPILFHFSPKFFIPWHYCYYYSFFMYASIYYYKKENKNKKKKMCAHIKCTYHSHNHIYIVSINSASWSTKYEYYFFIFLVQKYLCNSSIHDATHMTSHVISSRKNLKLNLDFFPMATKTCWFSTNLCTNWFPTNF